MLAQTARISKKVDKENFMENKKLYNYHQLYFFHPFLRGGTEYLPVINRHIHGSYIKDECLLTYLKFLIKVIFYWTTEFTCLIDHQFFTVRFRWKSTITNDQEPFIVFCYAVCALCQLLRRVSVGAIIKFT